MGNRRKAPLSLQGLIRDAAQCLDSEMHLTKLPRLFLLSLHLSPGGGEYFVAG